MLAALRTHGLWALAVALLLVGLVTQVAATRRAERALAVERTIAESRATLDRALRDARAVADAHRAGIEGVRAVVEAVSRVEEGQASLEVGAADADERAILDELRATGRVTEAARRSWERWRSQREP